MSNEPRIAINRLAIKPGTIDEFIEARHIYASSLTEKPTGLIGSRLYRGLDGRTVVLVSQFESIKAQEEIRQLPGFKENLTSYKLLWSRPVQPFMKRRARPTASISPAMPALRSTSRHAGYRRTAMQMTLIDTFIVSEESKPALLEASRTIQGTLKTLPGFVEGFVYEKRSGGGPYNIVTTAVWESEEAYTAAKSATAARFQAISLNPPEIMRALDVQVDRGVYVRTPY